MRPVGTPATVPDGFAWRCSRCGAAHRLDERPYTCGRCPQQGRLDLEVDPRRVGGRAARPVPGAGDRSLWRYAPLLPVDPWGPGATAVREHFPAGGTPLRRGHRLERYLGIAELWIKDEGSNPTGSLKDRASALVCAEAADRGAEIVVTASSGNAAAALAGVAAAVGQRCVVFVPAATSPAKLTQIAHYGARVLLVDGSYDDAVRLSLSAADRWGWYARNTGVNPYTAEGKKTVVLEVLEQLGWRVPDVVVVPVGDGNILAGVFRGVLDARSCGWIDRMPRLVGVQATGACAVYRAWASGAEDVIPGPTAGTYADSIDVGNPQDGFRALAAVRRTGGLMVAVDDEEIRGAVRRLASHTGVYPEPAAAATVAALPDLIDTGRIGPTDRVVVLSTGSGLKAPPPPAARDATPVVADLDAVAEQLDRDAVSPFPAT